MNSNEVLGRSPQHNRPGSGLPQSGPVEIESIEEINRFIPQQQPSLPVLAR